jgi:hypothetical protein
VLESNPSPHKIWYTVSYSACFQWTSRQHKNQTSFTESIVLVGETNYQVLKVDLGNGHNQFSVKYVQRRYSRLMAYTSLHFFSREIHLEYNMLPGVVWQLETTEKKLSRTCCVTRTSGRNGNNNVNDYEKMLEKRTNKYWNISVRFLIFYVRTMFCSSCSAMRITHP